MIDVRRDGATRFQLFELGRRKGGGLLGRVKFDDRRGFVVPTRMHRSTTRHGLAVMMDWARGGGCAGVRAHRGGRKCGSVWRSVGRHWIEVFWEELAVDSVDVRGAGTAGSSVKLVGEGVPAPQCVLDKATGAGANASVRLSKVVSWAAFHDVLKGYTVGTTEEVDVVVYLLLKVQWY